MKKIKKSKYGVDNTPEFWYYIIRTAKTEGSVESDADNFFQKMEKVLDKCRWLWYHIEVVAAKDSTQRTLITKQ